MHYCTSCLAGHPYKIKVFEDYPPEYVNFLNNTGHPYTPLPLITRCASEYFPEGSAHYQSDKRYDVFVDFEETDDRSVCKLGR